MILQCIAPHQCFRVPQSLTNRFVTRMSSSSETISATPPPPPPPLSSPSTTRREALSLSFISATCSSLLSLLTPASASSAISDFFELPNSGGVKALDLRLGSGEVPSNGDQLGISSNSLSARQVFLCIVLNFVFGYHMKASHLNLGMWTLILKVAIHYYGRLAAKQGWRFDSTYEHKDQNGEPSPFVFVLGSGKVISGIEAAVKSMKVGGIRRVIIPPSQGYQSTSQEPLPPNFFDRQRLFTTIFNPTRLANGEGSTLGTLLFDIELVSLRHQ